MSQINVKNLTFAYEGSYDNIFEDVSFTLDTTWKLGFTGRNGKGKTTFLHLLQGKYPYSGTITANVQFQYFPYPVPDKTLHTAEVVEAINPHYPQWQLLRELSLLDVNPDVLHRPFGTLSSGEQTKVLLAAHFIGSQEVEQFLLIDEPTNHLDASGRGIVSRYLRGKSGFIVVSHDRDFLDGCVTHILSISRAQIQVIQGNFTTWLAQKERQDNFELGENEKLKKDIKRLEKSAREKAAWSDKIEAGKIGNHAFDRGAIGAQAARMMKRSKAIERRQHNAIAEKSALLKNLDHASDLKVTQLKHHKEQLLAIQDLSLYYGVTQICTNINLDIKQGDRLALQGKNGSGKSTLLKLILGEDIAHTGTLTKASGLRISYVSQETAHLKGNLTDYARAHHIDESLFKTILRKLDFLRVQFEKDMADFSGGQKKKVLIAKSLCEQAHILLWDEPLNFIDVLSRIQIERLLLSYKPTILFVEHDTVFTRNIAERVVNLG